MSSWGYATTGYTAITPSARHACNCIGCCRLCGTCKTWPGHTAEYCALVRRWVDEWRTYLESRGL